MYFYYFLQNLNHYLFLILYLQLFAYQKVTLWDSPFLTKFWLLISWLLFSINFSEELNSNPLCSENIHFHYFLQNLNHYSILMLYLQLFPYQKVTFRDSAVLNQFDAIFLSFLLILSISFYEELNNNTLCIWNIHFYYLLQKWNLYLLLMLYLQLFAYQKVTFRHSSILTKLNVIFLSFLLYFSISFLKR